MTVKIATVVMILCGIENKACISDFGACLVHEDKRAKKILGKEYYKMDKLIANNIAITCGKRIKTKFGK